MELFCRYFSEIAEPARRAARLKRPPAGVESAAGGATLLAMSDQAAPPPRRRARAPSRSSRRCSVIGGAIALLLTASISKGAEYYKHVDEVMANIDALARQEAAGARQRRRRIDRAGEGDAALPLQDREPAAAPPAAIITATYNGLVPDTFKGGAEVVAKGTLTADNQLAVVPDGIMAKCPSKYDARQDRAPSRRTRAADRRRRASRYDRREAGSRACSRRYV